jgi:hypothetical protein
MTLAILLLCVAILVLLVAVLWVLSNIRDDQLVIRTWIGIQLGKKRLGANAPSLADWLEKNPNRPHKHDPPVGREGD